MSQIFTVVDDMNAAAISGGLVFKGPTTLVQSVDQLNIAKPQVKITPVGGKSYSRYGGGLPSFNIASIGDITLLNSAELNAAIFSA